MPPTFGNPSVIGALQIGESAVLVLTIPAGSWQLVTLVKNSSGTVVVGSSAGIVAANGGNGVALVSGTPFRMLAGPGTQIWAIAGGATEYLAFHTQVLDFLPLVVGLLSGDSAEGLTGQQPKPTGAGDDLIYPGQPGFQMKLKARLASGKKGR